MTSPAQLQLPFWQRLRSQLVIYLIAITVLPLVVVAVIISNRATQVTQQQVFDQLESIGLLKEQSINDWLADAGASLAYLSAAPPIQNVLTDLLIDSDNQIRQTRVVSVLSVSTKTNAELAEVFLYDVVGRILASSNPDNLGKVVNRQPYFAGSMAHATYTQPPFYDVGRQGLTVVVTRRLININAETIGIIAAHLDTAALGSIMLERTGLGATGETYLVSKENNYLLTPSRFEGYTLNRAYTSFGIEQALAGRNGEGIYRDYRTPSIPVYGVYRWIDSLEVGLLIEIDEAEALILPRQTEAITIVVSLVAVGVAILTGYGFASSIARPIRQLAQAAAQISQGDLTQRASVTSPNEIGILAQAFNQMTDKLAQNIGALDDKVNEVQDANQNLRIANAQAREAARLKSEFMATMSHELRTPLNAMLGFTGILLEGMGGEIDADARHMIQRVQENSKRLLGMINDVLDLAKIEAGRVEIQSLPFRPAALVEQWRLQTGVLAEAKGLTFQIEIDAALPDQLYGDPDRITQVAINLLSNAFKFTEQGGVTLSLQRQPNEWILQVSDTGVGIPPHALNFIFDEFRQVDGSSRRAFGGTGLGLAITRNLCRMMNGTIRVTSTLGEGSTFIVTLPLNEHPLTDELVLDKVNS